jgi:alpha-L-fucosidase
MKIYVASVGRNANLLLNIPVDTRGLIHPNDSASMMGFKVIRDKSLINLIRYDDRIIPSSFQNYHAVSKLRDRDRKSFWAANVKDVHPSLNIQLKTNRLLNAILIQEPIALGQRIIKFSVEVTDSEGNKELIEGRTIGNKRILPFKERKVKSIQVKFLDAKGQVLISNLELLRIISTRNESLYR